MGDLGGIFIFVIFVFLAVFAKAAQESNRQRQNRGNPGAPGQGQRTPQWPGPVAGPRPGTPPRPTWAPQAPQQPTWAPRPQPAPTQPPMQREAPRTLVSSDVFTTSLDDTEGVGTEGPSDQMVVGDPARAVDEEMNRFSNETAQFTGRTLTEYTDDLVKPETAPYEVTPDDEPRQELRDALADPASLTRAIVLAEVLGKPKALRGRGRTW